MLPEPSLLPSDQIHQCLHMELILFEGFFDLLDEGQLPNMSEDAVYLGSLQVNSLTFNNEQKSNMRSFLNFTLKSSKETEGFECCIVKLKMAKRVNGITIVAQRFLSVLPSLVVSPSSWGPIFTRALKHFDRSTIPDNSLLGRQLLL